MGIGKGSAMRELEVALFSYLAILSFIPIKASFSQMEAMSVETISLAQGQEALFSYIPRNYQAIIAISRQQGVPA